MARRTQAFVPVLLGNENCGHGLYWLLSKTSTACGTTLWSALMQISNESVELEELREMKADVERREKAQAAVLERQAKRLEELETLYKVML